MAAAPLDGELLVKRRRGRTSGYQHHDMVRARIRASFLVKRLMEHVRGHDSLGRPVELSMSQIRAAEILLRKVIPDLRQVEHTGEVSHRLVTELTDEQLAAIATSRSAGALAAPSSEDDAGGVH